MMSEQFDILSAPLSSAQMGWGFPTSGYTPLLEIFRPTPFVDFLLLSTSLVKFNIFLNVVKMKIANEKICNTAMKILDNLQAGIFQILPVTTKNPV